MRHGKKFNHLSRKSAHRKALLRNLSIALIEHKRIRTTVPKAKALRKFFEPLVTKAKTNTTHSRRVVFSYLQNKEAVKTLFGPIAAKVGTRPGGYLRILRTGFRASDSAEMCIIELVDFNEAMMEEATTSRKRTRRSSRRKKSSNQEQQAVETQEEETAEEDNTEDTAAEDTSTEDSSEEKKDDSKE